MPKNSLADARLTGRAERSTYGDIVRTGEDAVDAADPWVTAFETDDLSVNADGIHDDGSAMRTLGQRFAESLAGLPMSPTAQPAFQITGSYTSDYTGNFFLGYTFDLRRPITVTDLGTLDFGLTGLVYPSTVAIFDAETTDLITRITVPAYNAGGTAAAGFEWVEGRHGDYTAVAFPTTVSATPANWFAPNLLFLER